MKTELLPHWLSFLQYVHSFENLTTIARLPVLNSKRKEKQKLAEVSGKLTISMRARFEKELFSLKTGDGFAYLDEDIENRVANDERVQPQKRLMTPFLLDKRIPPVPTEEERILFTYRRNNIISEAFFCGSIRL